MATVSDPSVEELNRESARLEAETRKLRAEADKLGAEHYKFMAEQSKLEAERYKLERDRQMAPWLIVLQGLIAGAAIFGAALALLKYLHG